MIYLRTEDHEGFRSLKQGRGAIQLAGEEKEELRGRGWGAQKREPVGERGEEELCVMSVFPRQSYFEM